jgi:PPK2 family polyphosphate:nucleotide phosphotransferase
MKIPMTDFCISNSKKIDLKKIPTKIDPLYDSKDEFLEMLEKHISEMSALQDRFFAMKQFALLIIFQAMDAAGKDGMIKHVLTGINPQGCQVFNFKVPSSEELAHDFLWRTNRCLPKRGEIVIFNRSYYEEVLIVKVHQALLKVQGIPENILSSKNFWKWRYHSIVELEKHLYRNGTQIIKIFLHLSKEEQAKRFLKRIDDKDKNWKFSGADIQERRYWDDYQKEYEKCIYLTSTDQAPWYIVPADDKKNARLIVSQIFLETLRQLPLRYPKADLKHFQELKSIQKTLQKEK